MNAKQYTVRNVPPSIDRALRKKAQERGRSLNSVLLDALQNEAGVGAEPPDHHELDYLIGSWISDPAVNAALKEQRRVDLRDWNETGA